MAWPTPSPLGRAAALGVGGGQGAGTPLGLLHLCLHLWDRGTLALQRGMLDDHAAVEADTPYLLAQGLICVESGDLAVARACADEVASRRPVVPVEAHFWAVSVCFGAEIVYRTGHTALVSAIAAPSALHVGTGLSATGSWGSPRRPPVTSMPPSATCAPRVTTTADGAEASRFRSLAADLRPPA